MPPSFPQSKFGDACPIGVIIPTYNRVDTLLECMHHLEAQTFHDFEVLIVDDGSTDSTRDRINRYQAEAPFRLVYLYQPNSGQAHARNYAIQHLQAPICILIGDDIFPAPTFVETHLALHRAHPQLETVGLGLTTWCQRGQTVTPLMQWLGSEGVQFAYGELLRGTPPSWRHFYTSNLSLKSEYLRRNLFDERFRRYGMEDIELGKRLATRHGLAMHFLPDAIGEHLHPTDFLSSCRRATESGDGLLLFSTLWPEHRPRLPRNALKRGLFHLLAEPRVVLPFLTALTGILNRLWCPNPLLKQVLQLHAHVGYRRALRKANSSSPV